MQTPSLPPAADQQPADDHFLEDLVALTGLFTPEVIWHEEEKLDDLDEQEALSQKNQPAPPAQD